MPDRPIFIIPGQIYSSKNSREVRGGKVVYSDAVQKYIQDNMKYYTQYTDEVQAILSMMDKPYRCRIYFVMGTRQRWDYQNMCQLPCDMMQWAGWVGDDDKNSLITVPAGHSVNPDNPHIQIEFEFFPKEL